MYNATVGALVKETTDIEHTPRKAAEPEEEEEYPTRAAVRRFLAADVVEQAGLVRGQQVPSVRVRRDVRVEVGRLLPRRRRPHAAGRRGERVRGALRFARRG